MNKYSKTISTICYIRHNNKILMQHRYKKEKYYSKRCYRGLGGKAEQGENPIECIKREVKEEAGININPIWRGIVTFSSPFGNDWEAHVFIAEGYEGEIIENDEGELLWVNEADILKLDMPEGDKKILPLLFEKEKFHAHLKYGEKKNLVKSEIKLI